MDRFEVKVNKKSGIKRGQHQAIGVRRVFRPARIEGSLRPIG